MAGGFNMMISGKAIKPNVDYIDHSPRTPPGLLLSSPHVSSACTITVAHPYNPHRRQIINEETKKALAIQAAKIKSESKKQAVNSTTQAQNTSPHPAKKDEAIGNEAEISAGGVQLPSSSQSPGELNHHTLWRM
jgi:hypothetical protein